MQDCQVRICNNVHELIKALDQGNKAKATGETLMNRDSSRSHCIFTIFVETASNAPVSRCLFKIQGFLPIAYSHSRFFSFWRALVIEQQERIDDSHGQAKLGGLGRLGEIEKNWFDRCPFPRSHEDQPVLVSADERYHIVGRRQIQARALSRLQTDSSPSRLSRRQRQNLHDSEHQPIRLFL